MTSPITALFLDIGGVLMTNGWDRFMRRRACEKFHLDYEEMNERHHLTFDMYEEGRINLDEYLGRVVFHEPRSFTARQFKDFMFAQSQPHTDMIDFIASVKRLHGLKLVAVSNEGRELAVYRIRHCSLRSFIDFFVVSSFVQMRKPDPHMFRLALDVAQIPGEQIVYIEDRLLLAEAARAAGINTIHHTGLESTREALVRHGLAVEELEPASF